MSVDKKEIDIILKLNDQLTGQLRSASSEMENANRVINSFREITKKSKLELDSSNKVIEENNFLIKKNAFEVEHASDVLKDHKDLTKKADINTKSASSSVAGIARNLVVAAAAYVSINAAIGLYKNAISGVISTGSEFEQTLANTRAILQPTQEEFLALAYSAKELGKSTVYTASQAGQAYTELGKLGFDTSQILEAGNDVLTLAAAANLDMADAALASATVVRQFGLEAKQTSEVVDIMAKSFSISALDAENFTDAMRYVGPAASAAGKSVTETSAALATLADNGIKGSQAGTSLRRIIMELSNENSKANKIIRQINPAAQTLAEKFDALKKAGIDNASAAKLFRVEASTAALVLASNATKIESYAKTLEYADGAAKGFAKRVAAIQLDTLSGDVKIAKSAFEDLQISIFKAFDDDARIVVQKFTSQIREVADWVDKNPAKLDKWGKTAVGVFDLVSDSVGILIKGLEKTNDLFSLISPEKISFSEFDNAKAAIDLTAEYANKVKELDNEIKLASKDINSFELGDLYSKQQAIKALDEQIKKRDQIIDSFKKELDQLEQSKKVNKSLSDEDEVRLSNLQSQLKIMEKAKAENLSMVAAEKAIAKETKERLKLQGSKKLTANESADAISNLDVEAQKKAEEELLKNAKIADKQWKDLLRQQELDALTSDERKLAERKYFWEDLIAIDKAGGSRHVDELKAMYKEDIALNALPKFNTYGQERTTGGSAAAESSNKAREKAVEDYNKAYSDAQAIQKQMLDEAYNTERELEIKKYDEKLTILENYNLANQEAVEAHAKIVADINEKYARQETDAKLKAVNDLNSGLLAAAESFSLKNKGARLALKGSLIAEATANAIVAGLRLYKDLPLPLAIPASIGLAAKTAAQINDIRKLQFASGTKSTDASFSVVPGNSYTGDKVLAGLNSGEMILSRNEAKEYKNSNGGQPINVNYNPVYNYNASESDKLKDFNNFKRYLSSALASNDLNILPGAIV